MPSGGQNRGQRSFPLTSEQIRREYLDKDVSMKEASQVLGCSVKILWQACKDHGLVAKPKARKLGKGRPLVHKAMEDHDWLRAQIQTRPLIDIARELGITRIVLTSYAQRHGLYPEHLDASTAIRQGMRKKDKPLPKAQQIKKEDILREYIQKDINMYEACSILGCSPPTLIASMKFHGIPPKDHMRKIAIPGEHSGRWNGGRIRMTNGYISIRAPEHPYADKAGNVMEHRLVAEKMLGRYLRHDEHVHHLNGQRDDNREENLHVMARGEHLRHHLAERRAKKYGTKKDYAYD